MQLRIQPNKSVLGRQRLQALVHRMGVLKVFKHGLCQVISDLIAHRFIDPHKHHISRGQDVLVPIGLVLVGARRKHICGIARCFQIGGPVWGADNLLWHTQQAELFGGSELINRRRANGARAHKDVKLAIFKGQICR